MKLIAVRTEKKGYRQALGNVMLRVQERSQHRGTILNKKQYFIHQLQVFHLRILGTKVEAKNEICKMKRMPKTKVWGIIYVQR